MGHKRTSFDPVNKFIYKYGKIAGFVSAFILASVIVMIFALKHGSVKSDISSGASSNKFLDAKHERGMSLFEMNMREAIIICALIIVTAVVSFIVRKRVNYK